MNVGELKKIIENLPDDMPVGSSGHFGEFLECYSARQTNVSLSRRSSIVISILAIDMEDKGPDPD